MEWRLFDEGTVPHYTTPEFYKSRGAAPHLEQEGHRQRLLLAAEFVRDAFARDRQAIGIVDLGAGDGGLLSLFNPDVDRGYDLQPSNVAAAEVRGVFVQLRDVIADPPEILASDVLVACEVIEHLVAPRTFVRWMAESPARWLIASSPYTETPDSHYEYHTYCWDLDGYRVMLEQEGWQVVRQETTWISQVCLCTRA